MVAAVLLFAGAMLFYERREFDASMAALREQQAAIATAIAADFEKRISTLPPGPHLASPELVERLLGGATQLEQPHSRALLVKPPWQQAFVTTAGRQVRAPTLRTALEAGDTEFELPRELAAHFGLPARVAAAGLSRVRTPHGTWGVVVLASAQRLRARERGAQLRFLVGLAIVAVAVAGFGGLALRQQTRKLEVARALEIEALARERDRLLARADKMATLAALSSGVAHEIATPLSTIVARIEQVSPTVSGNERATAALQVATQQVQRIQLIVQALLGLARGQRASRVVAEPREIAANATLLVEHRFSASGVNLRREIATDLSLLTCDQPLIEQALANLLLNACDASTRGSEVLLQVRSTDGRLAFVVDDEGVGISAEAASTAKDPFVTSNVTGRGTGLGLAIAHEIVSSHGGRLVIAPRQERGTRAFIELPHT
jgi:signal transduction histidine kinase